MYSLNHEEHAFYQDKLALLDDTQGMLLENIEKFRENYLARGLRDPVEHCKSRIKCARSAKEKLARLELPVTRDAALSQIYDALGVRVVCTFISDVYLVRDWLAEQPEITIIHEKDYIKSPKPNGYRSCHLIVKVAMQQETVFAEIQIRTLAMDCWASLEHQLKYKQDIRYQEMIVEELKRCADELASTDTNLQVIRELIEADNGKSENSFGGEK